MVKNTFKKMLNHFFEHFENNSRFFIPIMGSLLILIPLFFIYNVNQTTQIATVDITRMVNQFVQAQTKNQLSPAQLQAKVKRFGQQLDTTVNAIAKQKHVVLLPAEAVIAGSDDYTALVQERLTKANG